MRLDEPAWWYPTSERSMAEGKIATGDWRAALLVPVASVYGRVAARRLRTVPQYRSRLPVVCIGNLTVGGTGKTPLAIAVAGLLRELGAEPWFLTRGYGGTIKGPHPLDPITDTAVGVGDEALLLATHAPVVVARDRARGAELIDARAPANGVIVMDDGLQNPGLAKDLTIAIVDARRGFGNGRVFPAGPLRAPIAAQLDVIDCIAVAGADATAGASSVFDALRSSFVGPVIEIASEPTGDTAWLGATPVLAFSGIANPRRFFDLVRRLGGDTQAERAFADHHVWSEVEAAALLAEAAALGATLVTTAKDHARLTGASGACARLRAMSRVVEIVSQPAPRDRERLVSLLRGILPR